MRMTITEKLITEINTLRFMAHLLIFLFLNLGIDYLVVKSNVLTEFRTDYLMITQYTCLFSTSLLTVFLVVHFLYLNLCYFEIL